MVNGKNYKEKKYEWYSDNNLKIIIIGYLNRISFVGKFNEVSMKISKFMEERRITMEKTVVLTPVDTKSIVLEAVDSATKIEQSYEMVTP